MRKRKTATLFFLELANFYANAGADKIVPLSQAQNTFTAAQDLVTSDSARAFSEFEHSRDLFERIGDECEAAVAENWAAQLLPGVAKLDEARRRLTAITESEESRNFKILLPSNYYWLGIADYRQGRFSDSARNLKTALRLAEDGNNAFEIQHVQQALAVNYSELGELEPALLYASKSLSDKNLYYQNP